MWVYIGYVSSYRLAHQVPERFRSRRHGVYLSLKSIGDGLVTFGG